MIAHGLKEAANWFRFLKRLSVSLDPLSLQRFFPRYVRIPSWILNRYQLQHVSRTISSSRFLETKKKKSRRQEKGREIQTFANEYQYVLSSARMRTGNKRVRIFLLSILIVIEIERLHASIDYKNTAISSLFKDNEDILLFSVISLHATSHERCEEERWTLLPRGTDAGRRKPPTRAVLLVTRANTSFLSLPAMCDTQPQP